MRTEYSYDLYNRASRIEGKRISEEKYDEIINSVNIKLVQEWETDYKDSTLYAKQYKADNEYTLFVWKEIFKK